MWVYHRLKFNFKHFLFSSPKSENNQKYEYFILLWSMISLDLWEFSSEQHAALSKSAIFSSKSVKYSYFWSFSDFGEENKKCLKLNFTGPEFFSLRQTHRRSSYKDSNISSPNFLKVTQLHRAFGKENLGSIDFFNFKWKIYNFWKIIA